MKAVRIYQVKAENKFFLKTSIERKDWKFLFNECSGDPKSFGNLKMYITK